MIHAKESMGLVVEAAPDFIPILVAHRSKWTEEENSHSMEVSEFSRHVVRLITEDRKKNLAPIFSVIEQLMTEGDDEVKDAVATCFLENLINRASSGEFDRSELVPLLGPNSRAYCEAWDEFCGVHPKEP